MRARVWLVCLCAVMAFAVGQAQARQDALQTFTTEDGAFTFDYPQGWLVEIVNPESETTMSIVVNNLPLEERYDDPQGVSIQFSPPRRSFDLGWASGETPREVVEQSLQFSASMGAAAVAINTPSPSGTSQPLEIDPIDPNIHDFSVEGRPGAYGYIISRFTVMGDDVDASQMVFVLDLGNDYWVLGYANSFAGGLPAIQSVENTILELVQTMRYTPPPPVYSGNPDLPQVFSGVVGVWQRGSIEFNYPAEWYVSNTLLVLLSNMPTSILGNVQPEPGQIVVQIQGVSETLSMVDPAELSNQCGDRNVEWTARKLVEQLLGSLPEARLEYFQTAGITLTQPEVVTVDGIEIVYFREYQTPTGNEVLYLFIDLGDSVIPQMIALSKTGEMATFEAQLFDIASTFHYTPRSCETTNSP